MRRSLRTIFPLLLLGIIVVWFLSSPKKLPPRIEAQRGETEVAIGDAPAEAKRLMPMPTQKKAIVEDDDDEDDRPKKKLDAKSEAFFDKLDMEVPRTLYRKALHCYKDGSDKDQKIKFLYKMRSINSEVQITETKVVANTLTDDSTSECIQLAIKNAVWKDEEMPDYEGDDELLIRLGAFKKFMPEDWEPKETAYTGPNEDSAPIGEGDGRPSGRGK